MDRHSAEPDYKPDRFLQQLNRSAACVWLLLPAMYVGDPSLAAAQPADASPELEEIIVVTARKREESVFAIPESVSVLSSHVLEARGISDLGGIATILPNLSYNKFQDAGTVYMSVRGVNSIRTGEPPVATVIDGVQLAFPEQITRDVDDIERVEVLKGPQGSLYGRNAIGGAINITTRAPSDEFEAEVGVSAGNGNLKGGRLMLNMPLSDTTSVRLRGKYRDFDGIIENSYLGKDADYQELEDYSARLYSRVSDDLVIDLRASDLDEEYGAHYYKAIPDGFVNDSEQFPVQSDRLGGGDRQMQDVALKLEYDTEAFTVSSITGYGRYDSQFSADLDFKPIRILEIGQRFDRDYWSQELRLASNGSGRFDWIAGAYYLDTDQRNTLPLYVLNFVPPSEFFDNTTVPLIRGDYESSAETFALFAQGDYELIEAMTLTVGVRYDNIDKSQTNIGTLAAPEASDSFSNVQPKGSLAYEWSEELMTYITVAKGFRSGGFNDTNVALFATYEEERLLSYEAGFKSKFADGRVALNGAVFYIDYDNRQDFFFDGSRASQNIYTAPKSRIYGIELEAVAHIAHGLLLTAGLGKLDSKFTDFDPSTAGYVGLPGEGNEYPYVNHLTGNLGVQYTRSLGGGWELEVGSDYSHKSDLYWWFTNFEKQDPVDLLNAYFVLGNEHLQFRLWSNNLTDEYYLTSYDPTYAFGLADNNVFPARGRTYGLDVDYAF